MCLPPFTYACTCIDLHTHTFMRERIFLQCGHVCMHLCMHVCMHVCWKHLIQVSCQEIDDQFQCSNDWLLCSLLLNLLPYGLNQLLFSLFCLSVSHLFLCVFLFLSFCLCLSLSGCVHICLSMCAYILVYRQLCTSVQVCVTMTGLHCQLDTSEQRQSQFENGLWSIFLIANPCSRAQPTMSSTIPK